MNAGALSRGGIELCAAAPVPDNPLNDGQSKSSAFAGRLGGIKGLECLGRDFGGHSAPGVGYRQMQKIAGLLPRKLYKYCPFAIHRMTSVLHQIQQDLRDLPFISQHQRIRIQQLQFDPAAWQKDGLNHCGTLCDRAA